MNARRASLPFIMVSLFMATLGVGLILPVMPKLIASFLGGDLVEASRYYGIFIALYATMQFVAAPILGGLSDRFGRRTVLLIAQLGATADYLLLAFAPNLGWFFLARAVAGITGASFSTSTAYIADITPPEKRAQSFGLVGAAFGLGFIVGPAVGGLLSQIDLRAPFLASAGLYFISFVYGLFVLPESLPPERRRAFSFRRANPLGALKNFGRHPMLVGLAATVTFAYLAQQVLQSIWVLHTQSRFGWSPFQVGMSLAAVGLATATVQGGLLRIIIPWLGPPGQGERRALLLGTLISSVFFIGFGLVTEGWMTYLLIVPFSFRGIAGPSTQALMTKHVAVNEQGELQASLSSLMSMTAIVGPIIGTRLFARFSNPAGTPYIPGASYFAASLLELCGLLIAARVLSRWRTSP